ncbi:MAG: ribosome silencing factor [Saprospiraceae bacterium]
MNQQQLTNEIASIDAFNDLIIESIQDIKGKKIIKLDLRSLDATPTDFFIICEGESNTQVKSIAGNIRKRVKEEIGILPSHAEGVQDGLWALMDYFNVVVHVFHPEKRAFYDLENLWSDADFTEYASL